MKLALIALTIEIALTRVFISSWGWAVVIVALYCTFVYIRKTIAIKKQNENRPETELRNTMIRANIRGNSNNQKLYNLHAG